VSDPTLPSDLASEMRDLKRRLDNLERSSALNSAAIRDGSLRILDDTNAEMGRIGLLADGVSYGINLVDGSLTIEGATVDAISAARGSATASNASLTTTPTAHASFTMAVPTWATRALVIATVDMQMTTPIGTPQQQQFRVDVDGSPGNCVWTNGIAANDTGYSSHTLTRDYSPAGATISVQGYFSLSLGTNNLNTCRVNALAIFMRV
jgi:hypothetical protein